MSRKRPLLDKLDALAADVGVRVIGLVLDSIAPAPPAKPRARARAKKPRPLEGRVIKGKVIDDG